MVANDWRLPALERWRFDRRRASFLADLRRRPPEEETRLIHEASVWTFQRLARQSFTGQDASTTSPTWHDQAGARVQGLGMSVLRIRCSDGCRAGMNESQGRRRSRACVRSNDLVNPSARGKSPGGCVMTMADRCIRAMVDEASTCRKSKTSDDGRIGVHTLELPSQGGRLFFEEWNVSGDNVRRWLRAAAKVATMLWSKGRDSRLSESGPKRQREGLSRIVARPFSPSDQSQEPLRVRGLNSMAQPTTNNGCGVRSREGRRSASQPCRRFRD